MTEATGTGKSSSGNLKEGLRLVDVEDFAGAERVFQEVVTIDPDSAEGWNNLGVLAFQRNEFGRAADCLARAVEINPEYTDALVNLCHALSESGNLDQALPLLEIATAREPYREDIATLCRKAKLLKENKAGAKVDSVQTRSVSGIGHSDSDVLIRARILQAPFEIAGNMGRLARMLRERGYQAASVNYYDSWLSYDCDVDLHVNRKSPHDARKIMNDFSHRACESYDIFHLHFAHSLRPDYSDLAELREAGKKIIFSFWGSDQRAPEWIYYQQARFLGYTPPRPFYLNKQLLAAHRIINRYADVMLGTKCIPRGLYFPGLIDTRQWNMKDRQEIISRGLIEKDPSKTYFVHAPSSNWKKGSHLIRSTLEKAKRDGLPIELLYVNQMPPQEARQVYAYADFAIDQVGVGTFGLFGAEMMSWRIPVLVHQIDLYDRIRNNPPVIRITRENFREQLEACIALKQSGELESLGTKSRRWVEENACMTKSIELYIELYRQLLSGMPVPQLVNRSWFDQEERILSGEKSDFYRFMIEHDVFAEIGIDLPDYDRELYS